MSTRGQRVRNPALANAAREHRDNDQRVRDVLNRDIGSLDARQRTAHVPGRVNLMMPQEARPQEVRGPEVHVPDQESRQESRPDESFDLPPPPPPPIHDTFTPAPARRQTPHVTHAPHVKAKIVERFPSGPKPRRSNSNAKVCLRPPPRTDPHGRPLANVPQDFLMPENHLAIAWWTPDTQKLQTHKKSYGNAKRQRLGYTAVADVVSNFYKRTGDSLSNIRYRVGGVCYEGKENSKDVRRKPDSAGLVTITQMGIVDVYLDTRYLLGAEYGDKLVFRPWGSGQSWKVYGPQFEVPLVEVFDESQYMQPNHVGAQPSYARMDVEAQPTHDHVDTTEYVATAPTVDGQHQWVHAIVPVTSDGSGLGRIELGKVPADPRAEEMLRTMFGDEDFESEEYAPLRSYLAAMNKLKISPWGTSASKANLSPEEWSRLDNIDLIFAEMMLHMGMVGGDATADAGGEVRWDKKNVQDCLNIYRTVLHGDLNPHNAEYVYPNFDAVALRLNEEYKDDRDIHHALFNTGLITPSMTKAAKWNLDLTNIENVDPALQKEVMNILRRNAEGEAKTLFVTYTACVEAARKHNGLPNASSTDSVNLFDVVFKLCERLDAINEQGDHRSYEAAARNIQNLYGKLTSALETHAHRDEVDRLTGQISTAMEKFGDNEKIRDKIAHLLHVPILGMADVEAGDVTPEMISRGADKLTKFEGTFNTILDRLNISQPPGGVYNINTGSKKILEVINEQLHFGSEGKPPELFSMSNVNLIMLHLEGKQLSAHDKARKRELYDRAAREHMDMKQLETTLYTLLRVCRDPDVNAFHHNSGPVFEKLNELTAGTEQNFQRYADIKHEVYEHVRKNPMVVASLLHWLKSKPLDVDSDQYKAVAILLPTIIAGMRTADVTEANIDVDTIVDATSAIVSLAIPTMNGSSRDSAVPLNGASLTEARTLCRPTVFSMHVLSQTLTNGTATPETLPYPTQLSPMFCPPILKNSDLWTSCSAPRERQLGTLLTNSCVYGLALAGIIESDDMPLLDIVNSHFSFAKEPGAVETYGVVVQAKSSEEAHQTYDALVGAHSDLFPAGATVTATMTSTHDENGQYQFGGDRQLSHSILAGMYKFTAERGHTHVTFCGPTFVDDANKMVEIYQNYTGVTAAKLATKVSSKAAGFPDLDEVVMQLFSGEAGLTTTDFNELFGEHLPPIESDGNKAPCYCIDSWWTLALQFAKPLKDARLTLNVTENSITRVSSLMACSNSLNKGHRTPDGSTASEALFMLYNHQSAAPLYNVANIINSNFVNHTNDNINAFLITAGKELYSDPGAVLVDETDAHVNAVLTATKFTMAPDEHRTLVNRVCTLNHVAEGHVIGSLRNSMTAAVGLQRLHNAIKKRNTSTFEYVDPMDLAPPPAGFLNSLRSDDADRRLAERVREVSREQHPDDSVRTVTESFNRGRDEADDVATLLRNASENRARVHNDNIRILEERSRAQGYDNHGVSSTGAFGGGRVRPRHYPPAYSSGRGANPPPYSSGRGGGSHSGSGPHGHYNPYEHVFATVVNVRQNIVTICLDPSLSIAPVHR
jgi:hypothetical protein